MSFSIDISNLAEKIVLEMPIPWIILERSSKNIVACSGEFSELTGYLKPELIGENLQKMLPENIRDHHDQLVEMFFEAPKVRRMSSESSSVSLIHKSGRVIPVEISLTPVNGEGKYAAAYVFDVSKMAKSKEDLQKANNEIRKRITELQDEDGDVREYNLEMEKVKAEHRIKMRSLLMVLSMVALLLLALIFKDEVSEVIINSVTGVCLLLIGTFLADLLTTKK